MGFLGKLAFWKKRDDLDDLGKELGLDKEFGLDVSGHSPDLGFGLEQGNMQMQPQMQPQIQQPYSRYGSFQQPSQGFNPLQSFQQPQQASQTMSDSFIASKNLEVISSKLDALRASLESINQRLANLEAIAKNEQEGIKRRYY